MFKKTAAISLFCVLAILGCTKIAHTYYWDITQNKINTLNAASSKLLDRLDEPLNINAYSTNIEVLNACEAILAPYKKQSKLLKINLQQKMIDPELASKLKVSGSSVLVVSYKKFSKAIDIKLREFNEQQISSLIQQVVNNTNHWLVFLSGHQEADPLDTSPLGLSAFAQNLKAQGMHIAELNLAQQQTIPNNTNTLIVANPQVDLLPLEKSLIHRYLERGGKLIWFTEPDSKVRAFIQEEFGVKLSDGVIIDPNSTKLGSPHPALKILVEHPQHAITTDIKTATLMPWSASLDVVATTNHWQPEAFIKTNDQAWTYTGSASQDLYFMAQNKQQSGPLNIGLALTRTVDAKEQRAMIVADSTFISNKYLPLYANAQLASNLVGWLQNDSLAQVFSPSPAKDLNYQPNNLDRFLFSYGFTIILPLLLIGVGLLAEPRI